jgi:hypothetical protein
MKTKPTQCAASREADPKPVEPPKLSPPIRAAATLGGLPILIAVANDNAASRGVAQVDGHAYYK